MRFWHKGLTAVLAIALSGCATLQRDRTINLECPALERHMQEVVFDLQPDGSLSSVVVIGAAARNEIMRAEAAARNEIMRAENAEISPASVDYDLLSRAMTNAVDRWSASSVFENNNRRTPPTPPAILILSGGGQWGAFGAGYLRSLSNSDDTIQSSNIVTSTSIRSDENAIRNSDTVTGISTGAIQTLFVLADDYDGLYDAYTAHETEEYARVYSGIQPLINGSRYSIRPLLGLLRARLMGSDGKPSLLSVIAHRLHHRTDDMRGPRDAFVGMVNARTGNFVEVDLSELIRDIVPDGEQPSAEDAECVAAVVLASSAIPVNFEPVSISYGQEDSPTRDVPKRDVFYDGGVRQSVFFNHITSSSIAQMERFRQPSTGRREAFGQPLPDSLPFYVIRNGPSTIRPSTTINDHPDILSAAERGYSIIVNQSEVMAVCSLRLGNPSGQIWVQTADRYRTTPGLETGPPPGSPFNADFMDGLAALGKEVGNGANGQPRWLTLQPIQGGQPSSGCVLQ